MYEGYEWHARMILADLYAKINELKLRSIDEEQVHYKHFGPKTYKELLKELEIDSLTHVNIDELGHVWKFHKGRWYVHKLGCGWVAEPHKV